jgi:hypothetical protein
MPPASGHHQLSGITLKEGDELLITAASLGTKKERKTYCNVLDDVMGQTINAGKWVVDFRP